MNDDIQFDSTIDQDSLVVSLRKLPFVRHLVLEKSTNLFLINHLYKSSLIKNTNRFEHLFFRKSQCKNIPDDFHLIIATEGANYFGKSFVFLLSPNDKIYFFKKSYIDYSKGVYSEGQFIRTKVDKSFLLLSYKGNHSGTNYKGTDIYELSNKPNQCLEINFSRFYGLEYCVDLSKKDDCVEWSTDISIENNKAILTQNIKDAKGNERTKVEYYPLCKHEEVTLTSD